MNKSLIGWVIILLGLLIIFELLRENSPYDQESLSPPDSLGSYSVEGDYKIDPETILGSLENGNPNVFQPLLEDPRDVEEITGISISWTQADFMRVFSALSKLVWNDPMDPKIWHVYDIDFTGGCAAAICDLDSAQIAYFKTIRNSYATRFMSIHPHFGFVSWGEGASYPQPLLYRWRGVELATSKVTAEEALRIAETNGGREDRQKATDGCYVSVSSSRYAPEYWDVLCVEGYTAIIDLKTGKFKSPGY